MIAQGETQDTRMIQLRREGLRFSEIGDMLDMPGYTVRNRIAAIEPGLVGKRSKPNCDNTRPPMVEVHHAPGPIPKTGSESGFIAPLPLSRLMGCRA